MGVRSRAGAVAGAGCAGRSQHTDGGLGADVLGRLTIRDEDVEAPASAMVVRCVGEDRLQALAAPMGLRGPCINRGSGSRAEPSCAAPTLITRTI